MKNNLNYFLIFITILFFGFCVNQIFINLSSKNHINDLRLIVFETNRFQEKVNNDVQSQLKELEIIFKQKFLQEMVTEEPKLRTLEYRSTNQSKPFRISI